MLVSCRCDGCTAWNCCASKGICGTSETVCCGILKKATGVYVPTFFAEGLQE